MDNFLILGGNSGIGQAVADIVPQHPQANVWCPSKSELDVVSPIQVRRYIHTHGPFSHIVYSAGVNRLKWISDNSTMLNLEYTFDVNAGGFVSIVSEHLLAWPEQD